MVDKINESMTVHHLDVLLYVAKSAKFKLSFSKFLTITRRTPTRRTPRHSYLYCYDTISLKRIGLITMKVDLRFIYLNYLYSEMAVSLY